MKTAVIGMQYGDEGKARVVGYYQEKYDFLWSVRFNGANNAGHTVYDKNGKVHKLHCVPAGAVFDGTKCVIDAGCVLSLPALRSELKSLNHMINLYISENVHLITSEHVEKDSRGSGIGSTKRGVSYAYADRALRKGKRITNNDLRDFGIKATIYRGLPPIGKGESALYEGAQAIMLDIDYGDYPYVTSSSIMPSMAHKIEKIVGVMKAYNTRVGDGPPYYDDIPKIREAGNEYGTTTGRPRKCFWNDLEQLDYAFSVVQPDEVVVTKMDIFNDFNDISVYQDGQLKVIGNIDAYKEFLANRYPAIKYFSASPKGELLPAR